MTKPPFDALGNLTGADDGPAVVAQFVKERETKNTVRFVEVVTPGDHPVIGYLYISKEAIILNRIPEKVQVLIMALNRHHLEPEVD